MDFFSVHKQKVHNANEQKFLERQAKIAMKNQEKIKFKKAFF